MLQPLQLAEEMCYCLHHNASLNDSDLFTTANYAPIIDNVLTRRYAKRYITMKTISSKWLR